MSWNLADLFESVVDVVPDRTALTVPNAVGGPQQRTFAELDARANRLAHALADRGISVGDKVGIYAYNSPEWVEAQWAAWKLRAVPINVNYRYVENELSYLFDNADLAALVHGAEFSPRDRRGARPVPPAEGVPGLRRRVGHRHLGERVRGLRTGARRGVARSGLRGTVR